MTRESRSRRWCRRVAIAVVSAVFTSVSAPAFAASTSSAKRSPFSAASVDKAVAAVAAPSAPAPKAAKAPAKAPQASGSFLKSKTGLVVLAVFAVGTGYAVYSLKEDRIRGLNR